jgi:Protein of unknown function DUF262/Protein of unknown function (DUF1524)
MTAANFQTENNTLRKLLGNGLTYRIPRFQRDYSWGEEEWDDLWQDLTGTLKSGGEPAHYMGYLVLQSSDEKTFDVIDGQQRLTTLSIIVLAALKLLAKLQSAGIDPDRNRQRSGQLRSTYIGYLDPVSLVARSKLTLNRNNDDYYQKYLVPLKEPLPLRGFRASEHQLRKAFLWFESRIESYASQYSEQGVELARLIDSMSDKLFFTVITVTDQLNAYKVFETLNARGVRLSVTDLLKNYLFSVLHNKREDDREIEALEDRWEALTSRLGGESLPDFLRMHWNSRRPSVRQSELFKLMRGKLTERAQVFSLLNEMDDDIDIYRALTEPENSHLSPAQKSLILTLKIFGARQPFPLLMAAHRRFPIEDFETILKAVVVITFRYNVIGGQNTGDQERVYHSVAGKIAQSDVLDAAGAIRALREIYPADPQFKAAFGERTFKTSRGRHGKVVRYILTSLERQVSHIDADIESPSLTIEHVLPQNPTAGWIAFNEDPQEHEALAYRIGNMALLESGLNRDIGNSDFPAKAAAYRKSQFALTRRIAEENQDWTPDRIEKRQASLAKIATSVWRIDQLS